MTLGGKHIIVGVTGSIAAYKAAMLVRLLVKAGVEVRVVMTATAKLFISPLTMATLARHPVLVDFFDPENGAWNSHIDLGTWADAILIAPATAHTIAMMAGGAADNLLLTTYLSARCPVFVAPAMDAEMYRHPATIGNLQTLQLRGVRLIEPTSGELASGLNDKGRMAEPEDIVNCLDDFYTTKDFAGRRILLTAGPTREPIDPVRYLSNYSTGKMGFALAEELARRGADVLLIAGPTHLRPKHPLIKLTPVQTAAEMYAAAVELFPTCNAAVMCAAVADFTFTETQAFKIKEKQKLTLSLKPTADIAATLGGMKREDQRLVGFALETDHELENATDKLKRKNLDFIVLNSLKDTGAGFSHDTNRITIIDKSGSTHPYPLKSKAVIAGDIVDFLQFKMNG